MKKITIILCLLCASIAAAGIKTGAGPAIKPGVGASINGNVAPSVNRDVWIWFGQSNTGAADALVDPTGGGIKTLSEMDLQTAADLSALLICAGTIDGLPSNRYAIGPINGYPGASLGNLVDGNGNPYINAGDEVKFNRDLYAAGSTSNAHIKYYGISI